MCICVKLLTLTYYSTNIFTPTCWTCITLALKILSLLLLFVMFIWGMTQHRDRVDLKHKKNITFKWNFFSYKTRVYFTKCLRLPYCLFLCIINSFDICLSLNKNMCNTISNRCCLEMNQINAWSIKNWSLKSRYGYQSPSMMTYNKQFFIYL
jgi:hypothetical protein